MEEHILSLNGMERILKKAGAPRVSERAKVAMRDVVERQALHLAERASTLAEHAGRRTVQEADVKLAQEHSQ